MSTVLIDPDRVWLVDWPWAARGTPAFGLVGFAPGVAMQGGPEPEELLAMSSYGRAADPEPRGEPVQVVVAVGCRHPAEWRVVIRRSQTPCRTDPAVPAHREARQVDG